MKAALGLKVHSGWATLVALGQGEGSPQFLDRRRIEFVPGEVVGGKQPYHAAQGLEIRAAARLVDQARASACERAEAALGAVVRELEARGAKVQGCGVLLGSSRALPALEKILAAHPLLHAAEGRLFRDAVTEAASKLRLTLTTVLEKEIVAEHAKRSGWSAPRVDRLLAAYKKEAGPPFRLDEKAATLVAFLALAP
jgi:hypothetical protein